jgi:hypothetical protein
LNLIRRQAYLSQEHLKDSITLLDDMPGGKEMVNIGSKANGAKNLPSANMLYFQPITGRDGRIRTADFLLPKQAR